MTASFDLISEPWVPCVGRDGQAVELGLQDVLVRAHELRELGGESPLVTAALHRLLLVVLHRVFGSADYDAWYALWQAGRFDPTVLDAYFAQWRERFDLFHPARPFYQAADDRVKPKSLTSLVHDVASGNNATLFDHHTDDGGLMLTPAQAARFLVVAQAFGLAGLSGLPQKFTDGPCARGIIFLVQGDTLFETLLLNLLRYDEDHPLPRRPDDRPAWEMDDPFQDNRTTPRGYLDYLAWQNRRILLLPETTSEGVVIRQMTLAPGLRLAEGIADPMKPYRRDEKRGLLPLRFNENRALWRDSATLFQLDTAESYAPRAFAWLAELVGEGYLPRGTRRTLALGMANDQAKVEFFRTEHLPLPLAYLRDQQLVNSLRDDVLDAAENVARQLWGAARTMATFVLAPQADSETAHQPAPEDLGRVMAPWGVERRYWSRLEVPFRLALEGLPEDREGTLTSWQQTLRRMAWDAFEAVAEDVETDPRALKAAVRGREQLAAGLAKALPV
ncbi:MAG: type I-E CRISPR-associated protein Cse1/CasA [Anaerolineae bacterium CG2_30_64_16]|nr:MAG: type I-E CRISPR-associated protein Cse1/CasA [Anaerolineae bacterium CG2_30_64_16]